MTPEDETTVKKVIRTQSLPSVINTILTQIDNLNWTFYRPTVHMYDGQNNPRPSYLEQLPASHSEESHQLQSGDGLKRSLA